MRVKEVEFYIEKSKKEAQHTLLLVKDDSRKYVLSKYTPMKDAEKYIPKEKGDKETVWIILGFGMGHVVRKLLAATSNETKIIVIEPSKELLDEQLKYDDNRLLDEYSNIHFITGDINQELKKKVSELLPIHSIHNIKFISLDVYLYFYLSYYKKIKEVINQDILNKHIEINTIKVFNRVFSENVIKNRAFIKESYDLKVLKDKYKNVPALVVSAGPSLNKNIQYIKDFKGITCVGNRTLKPVLQQEVCPDFLCGVDPQEATFTTLKCDIPENVRLIATDSANTKFIEAHKGKHYFINTPSNAKALLGTQIVEDIPIGGSVATLCLSALTYMGCNPIILIGQDFAYTGNQKHAEECAIMPHLNTINTIDGTPYIKGYYGDSVPTSYQFITYLKWFEEFINAHKETTFINATEGGAYIEGAMHQSFKETIEAYKHVKKPDLSLYEKKIQYTKEIETYLDEVCTKVKDASRVAYRGQRLSQQLKVEYEKYKGLRTDRIKKISKGLDGIDRGLKKDSIISEITALVFAALNHQIESDSAYNQKFGETIQEEGSRIAELSLQLYKNIEDTCNQYYEVIEESR